MARVWGSAYRTWFSPDIPRQRKKAKRRSAKRERQQARFDIGGQVLHTCARREIDQ